MRKCREDAQKHQNPAKSSRRHENAGHRKRGGLPSLFSFFVALLSLVFSFHLHADVLVVVVTVHLHQLRDYRLKKQHAPNKSRYTRRRIRIHSTRLSTFPLFIKRSKPEASETRVTCCLSLTIELGLLERLNLADVDVLHWVDTLYGLEDLPGDVLRDAEKNSIQEGRWRGIYMRISDRSRVMCSAEYPTRDK